MQDPVEQAAVRAAAQAALRLAALPAAPSAVTASGSSSRPKSHNGQQHQHNGRVPATQEPQHGAPHQAHASQADGQPKRRSNNNRRRQRAHAENDAARPNHAGAEGVPADSASPAAVPDGGGGADVAATGATHGRPISILAPAVTAAEFRPSARPFNFQQPGQRGGRGTMHVHGKGRGGQHASNGHSPAQHSGKHGCVDDGALRTEARDDAPACLICMDPIVYAAVGACGHAAMCAECCLKLRLCYGNSRCPACNCEQAHVALAAWRADLGALQQQMSGLVGKKDRAAQAASAPGQHVDFKWASGVFVVGEALWRHLRSATSMACRDCDAAMRGFAELRRHATQAHSQHVCEYCVHSHRFFAKELDLRSAKDHKDHVEQNHPPCQFCRTRFYDGDALFEHMRMEHLACHVCEASGAGHRYFETPGQLHSHLTEAHHACTEDVCQDAFVAFATAEELRVHRISEHSNRMLPIDRSRVRTMQVAPAPRGAPRPAAELEHSRSGRPRGAADRRAAVDAHSRCAAANAARSAERGSGGGFVMFDDTEGTVLGLSNDNHHDHDYGYENDLLGSAWSHRSRGQSEPAFPALPTALAPRSGAPASAPLGRQPPPLVRKVMTCPCGAYKRTVVVEEGSAMEAVECQAACRAARRKAQLAEAFDKRDDAPSVFVRERDVAWPVALVLKAREDLPGLEANEGKVRTFVQNDNAKALTLAGLQRTQVELLTELSTEYGLAARPLPPLLGKHRLQLLKGAGTALPTQALMAHVKTLTLQDLAALKEYAATAFTLQLTDVERPAIAVATLRPFGGELSLDEANSTAVVKFPDARALTEARDRIGGGRKGAFIVAPQARRPHTDHTPAPAGVSGASQHHAQQPFSEGPKGPTAIPTAHITDQYVTDRSHAQGPASGTATRADRSTAAASAKKNRFAMFEAESVPRFQINAEPQTGVYASAMRRPGKTASGKESGDARQGGRVNGAASAHSATSCAMYDLSNQSSAEHVAERDCKRDTPEKKPAAPRVVDAADAVEDWEELCSE